MSETKVELQGLWQIGIHVLPAMANVYAEAAGKVDETRNSQSNLFETPGMPEGAVSTVFPTFCELRDQLQSLSRRTCINLRDSGAGCAKAADDFAKNDLSNAERTEYAAENKEYGEEYRVTPPENPPAP
ncbi:MAG: hypothetical protein ACRD0P_03170 [Stackebrandtia sp.]